MSITTVDRGARPAIEGRRPRLALLAVLFVALLCAARVREAPAAATVQARTLDNGLTVVVEERSGALAVGVTLAVRAGTRDDTPARAGEITLLARALFGGTPERPSPARLTAPIRATGGQLDLSVDADLTTYTALVPAGELDTAVDTLADMLLHPRFGVADLTRGLIDTGLGAYYPFDEDLAAALWPDHPAGRSPGGTARTRDAITFADLLALRERYFGARNMALAVVGPAGAEAVFARVAGALGSLPAGTRQPIVTAPVGPPNTERREFVSLGELATVIMAFPTPGWDTPDAAVLTVLDLLLSGPDGLLFQDVRSGHGLARDVDALAVAFADVGAMGAVARVQPANVEATVERFASVFQQLREEAVTEQTLAGVRERVTGLLLLARAPAITRSDELATTALLRPGRFDDADELAALARVTPEDVRRVAASFFTPDRAVVHVHSPDAVPSPRR